VTAIVCANRCCCTNHLSLCQRQGAHLIECHYGRVRSDVRHHALNLCGEFGSSGSNPPACHEFILFCFGAIRLHDVSTLSPRNVSDLSRQCLKRLAGEFLGALALRNLRFGIISAIAPCCLQGSSRECPENVWFWRHYADSIQAFRQSARCLESISTTSLTPSPERLQETSAASRK